MPNQEVEALIHFLTRTHITLSVEMRSGLISKSRSISFDCWLCSSRVFFLLIRDMISLSLSFLFHNG